MRSFCLLLLIFAIASGVAPRAVARTQTEAPAPVGSSTSTAAKPFEAGAWKDLTEAFAAQPDAMAEFTERRYFPFKEEPAVLRGEVRVSRERGLSLAYLSPDQRVVIVDGAGLALREKNRTSAPPADERSAAINRALLNILHFDFTALATEFELGGERAGAAWTLTLVPRDPQVMQAFRRIVVSGENTFVQRIELRRSQRQYIEILMSGARPPTPFTAAEIERYFR